MKALIFLSIWSFTINFLFGQDLLITGVIDGPLSGGTPKAIEFVALKDIPDLSKYGFGSANNGLGSDGEEFTFPTTALAKGTFVYVASETAQFNAFFGFNPDYTSSAASVNGDDAIELFFNGTVVDVFGDINTDGTGQNWEYLDGWAYRKSTTTTPTASFDFLKWNFSGINALDGALTNATATAKFPLKTFDIGTLSVNYYKKNIKIHPNPTTNMLFFDGLESKALVNIYSLTGQRVMHQETYRSLDVSKLISGVYLLELMHKETVTHQKLLIQ
jgi:hypothetical protein